MKLKFEYVFAIILLAVLSVGFFVSNDKDMKMAILTALVSGLTAITTFFFTKHNPNNPE